jgi:hypothetical protein
MNIGSLLSECLSEAREAPATNVQKKHAIPAHIAMSAWPAAKIQAKVKTTIATTAGTFATLTLRQSAIKPKLDLNARVGIRDL